MTHSAVLLGLLLAQDNPPPDPRVAELEKKVADLDKAVTASKRLKFTGYIQGRHEWHDDSADGVSGSNAPTSTSRFLVRRARIKATYAGDFSEYMLQIDAAVPETPIRDAEASLVLNNINMATSGKWELKFSMGQLKAPFGHEVLQSSGDREMPERAAVIRRFFPGERDRGLRVQATWQWLKLQAAVINGNFIQDSVYRAFDQNAFKDVVGRIGADFGVITGGLSGYVGHTLRTTLPTATAPLTYAQYERKIIGADLQYYLALPVGTLALKGEVLMDWDKAIDFRGVGTDPCTGVKTIGWIATAVQNIKDKGGVVVRVDQLDLNRSPDADCTDAVTAAAKDRVTTLAGGVFANVSANLRASVIYEHIIEQGSNKKDNDALYTQLQAKF